MPDWVWWVGGAVLVYYAWQNGWLGKLRNAIPESMEAKKRRLLSEIDEIAEAEREDERQAAKFKAFKEAMK
ncbi:MAG: hypothetical protein E6Q97_04355 [Desulfurellales bacterium]|nr:MAG: hypothetical protein E6Q97_04355 [Desulfurellales bacterium]